MSLSLEPKVMSAVNTLVSSEASCWVCQLLTREVGQGLLSSSCGLLPQYPPGVVSFQQSRESERSRVVKRQRKDREPQKLSIPFLIRSKALSTEAGLPLPLEEGTRQVVHDSGVGVTAVHCRGMHNLGMLLCWQELRRQVCVQRIRDFLSCMF